MSEKPTHEGTFILRIDSHSVGLTGSSKLPQFIFEGQLLRKYDEVEGEWVEWAEYDQSARGYMVTVGKDDKKLLNHKQVMLATGWDGESYKDLMLMPLEGTEVLVRMENDTYEGKTSLKIQWIDHKDTDPSSSIKKLDDDAIAAIDKAYGNVKKTAASKPKNSRPATPPKGGKKGKKTDPTKPKAAPPAGATAPTTKAPAPVATSKTTSPESVSPEPADNVCKTKEEAWAAVQDLKSEKMSDADLTGTWTNAVLGINGGDEDSFGPTEWTQIYHNVMDVVGLF